MIEGIHGLNDKLSYALPTESKFKIYISALTQLNVDEHNRIRHHGRTADPKDRQGCQNKRDFCQGNHCQVALCAKGRGAEIFFRTRKEADVMFNSALIYELACLKVYAEPLLFRH